MSDVIPPPPRRDGGGCWKWGAISCVGLGCLGAIVILIGVTIFLKGPVGQQVLRSSHEAARIARELPAVAGALAKYRNDKGDYPNKLTDLAPKYISADRLRSSAGPYRYTKPPKNAPESFPVVTVEIPLMQGAPPMVIRLLKDGTVEPPRAPERSWTPARTPGAN